jgi:hypothetical protein
MEKDKISSCDSLAPSTQQSCGQSNKIVPQKTKGTKQEQGGVSSSYFIEQEREEKCWRCGGLHQKMDCPNHLKPSHPTLTLANHVYIVICMGIMQINVSHFIHMNCDEANYK